VLYQLSYAGAVDESIYCDPVASRAPIGSNRATDPDARFPTRARLRDGSELVIRPVRPEDKGAIVSGFERMSPESRYRRFFAPLQRLTERDLAYLTEVDHHDHEALIAFAAGSGEPVGVARFIRGSVPTEAEVAVTVVDDWQGRGAATALLECLVERAREEGVERFLALVLSENKEALELFRHAPGQTSEPRRSASGHLELLIDLPEPGADVSESLLGRALRAAARGVLIANPWRVIRERIGR
jgi:GNAT superfamily N-acetyltransferase